MRPIYHKSKLRNIGLQFFAEPGGDPGNQDGDSGNQGNQGKSYTQDQINTMMATEKRTARQALLKELGFEVKDDKSFKDTLKSIKDTLDAGKTQAQRDKEAKEAAESERDEANSKVNNLQLRIDALSAGVKADCLDDAITLAKTHITEENPASKVFEEFKEKYPMFYGESSGGRGTGNPNNPPRHNNGEEGLGKRLAQASKPVTKSSYFKN